MTDAPELPAAVRARVLALAAAALRTMPEPEVPASLRAVRRFTPAKQLRLGGTALAVALEVDEAFRERVAADVEDKQADLAQALRDGSPPSAVPAVEVAAVAYLLRAPGWPALLARVEQDAARAAADEDTSELLALRTQLADLRADAKAEAARLRAEAAQVRAEADDLRRRLRSAEAAGTRAAGELAVARTEADQRLASAQEAAAVALREAEAEARRWRTRAMEAEAASAAARRAARESRGLDTVRLRVLLDTVLSATAGLRRELDLPLVVDRPADTVAGVKEATAGTSDPLAALFAARGLTGPDPALVDGVLAAPDVHLLVDGYNVTKTGYPEATLEAQRTRLLAGLGALAARSPGAEITCVFDGTAATSRPTALPVPRGVRVLYSAVGELADELIVRLVRAEPDGRPVAVVTNDGEVIAAVRAAGARNVPSEALLRRLERS